VFAIGAIARNCQIRLAVDVEISDDQRSWIWFRRKRKWRLERAVAIAAIYFHGAAKVIARNDVDFVVAVKISKRGRTVASRIVDSHLKGAVTVTQEYM